VETRRVDVAVIGSGTAGLNARREAHKAGASVVMIESGLYGTTCARVGCMPSKLLIAGADAAHHVAHADRFGIKAESWSIDGPAVLERVRRERDRFVGFVVEDTEALPEDQRIRGHARFVGPNTLEVGDHTRLEAGAVVIATGSTPFIPPPFDAVREHVMINDDVFELEQLPESLAVVGMGIIGLELGQALSRLGVDVTFFAASDRIGPVSDPQVKTVVRQVFENGLDLHLNTRIAAATVEDGGMRLRWHGENGSNEGVFERVLVAAGRRPNMADLGLENTGLMLDEHGMPLWNRRTTQCGDLPIFLAGDVAAHRPLLHEASDEGRIAGANAAGYPEVLGHIRRTPLSVVFSDPQIAIAGCSHEELNPDEMAIGEVSFFDQGRARVMGENRGIVRIYADRKTCRLAGAEMFGPRMEHMAHLLSWAVAQDMSVHRALQMPFYHPVMEEGLRAALRDLAKQLDIIGECRPEEHSTAPGC